MKSITSFSPLEDYPFFYVVYNPKKFTQDSKLSTGAGSQTSPYFSFNPCQASTCPGSYSPGFPHCKNALKATSPWLSKKRIA